MEEIKIIDTIDNTDIDAELKAEKKKYLIRIGSLIILNTTMFSVFIKDPTISNMFMVSLNANLIGFNIVGFILGSVVAAFPYKGLPYSKKYYRSSLLTILTLQTIMSFMLFSIVVMTFLGWYPN